MPGSTRTNSIVLDRLRLAVLEDLEVRRLQALDDLAVALRIHIDGDEDGLAAKDGWPLLLRGRLLLLVGRDRERAGENRYGRDDGGQDRTGRSSKDASAHDSDAFQFGGLASLSVARIC